MRAKPGVVNGDPRYRAVRDDGSDLTVAVWPWTMRPKTITDALSATTPRKRYLRAITRVNLRVVDFKIENPAAQG
jgi:hypothetical protein